MKIKSIGKIIEKEPQNKIKYKIIVEYYPYEILVYCPEIPFFHSFYDTDVPYKNIKQRTQNEIKEILSMDYDKIKKQRTFFISHLK